MTWPVTFNHLVKVVTLLPVASHGKYIAELAFMCDGLEAAAGAPQSLVYKKAPDRLAVSESLSGSPPLTNVHLHKTCQTGNRQAYSGLFRAPACMRRCVSATVIATPLTWFMESEFAVSAFGRAFVQGNPVSMPHRHNTNNIETNELFLLLLIVSACSVFQSTFTATKHRHCKCSRS